MVHDNDGPTRQVHQTRRAFVSGFACTAVMPAAALAKADDPPSAADLSFMRMAIDETRQADFPFGAVIVRDGAVIARGRNLGRTTHDPPPMARWSQSGAAWRGAWSGIAHREHALYVG
jgi:hypothetical protein